VNKGQNPVIFGKRLALSGKKRKIPGISVTLKIEALIPTINQQEYNTLHLKEK